MSLFRRVSTGFIRSRLLSSIAADGSQGPKHFGKKSDAFTRLSSINFEAERQAAPAVTPPSTGLKRALHTLSNIIFFGGVGVGAAVGYVTYFHDQDDIRKRIRSRKESDGALDAFLCQIMEYYLEKRTYFEGEIKSFAVPRQDRLLPDLPHTGLKTWCWTSTSCWSTRSRPGWPAGKSSNVLQSVNF